MRIEKNRVVSLRYSMKNDRGEMLENKLESSPVQYVHGSNTILPSLESELEGLAVGDQKSITLYDPQFIGAIHFEIVIDAVRAASPDEVKSGKPVATECGPGCCC